MTTTEQCERLLELNGEDENLLSLREVTELYALSRTLAPKLARDVQRKDEVFAQLVDPLKKLLSEIEPLASQIICPKDNTFSRQVVTTRSALAAIEAELKEEA